MHGRWLMLLGIRLVDLLGGSVAMESGDTIPPNRQVLSLTAAEGVELGLYLSFELF